DPGRGPRAHHRRAGRAGRVVEGGAMNRARRHRGVVLLSVLIVIAMAALAGTTAMYLVEAQMGSAHASLKRTQAPAPALAGGQAVMGELADQREKLLDGGAPDLTQRWDLFTDDNGTRAVVRLVAWGESGPVAQSEDAKLDLNSATADMLGKLGLDEKAAAAIVA